MMPIAINFKVCDNSPDCLAILVCPTKALYFDKEKKSLIIDNSKCTNCGKCIPECEVDAIKFAKDDKELKKVQEEIDSDSRKASELFIDRYGGEPQDNRFFCPSEKFDIQILQATKLTIVECFDEESIHCLVYSIPIKELFEDDDIAYRKFAVEDEKFKTQYNIKKLPALLFFNEGKIKGKIEGYYSMDNKKELVSEINKLL
jgi:NAD-dependent dihydropyrimidine dehydrogenase PreA subunit